MKEKSISLIKSILNLIIIVLLGAVCVIFSILYIDTFCSGFIYEYNLVLKVISIALATLITIGAIIFFRINAQLIYKICYITIVLVALFLVLLYVLNVSGIMSKIKSIEELRKYISSMGVYAWLSFIILQCLQVCVLPIPAFVSVGVGVLLFGPLKCAIYSFVGILVGSIIAFFVGRKLGYKVACWLVGKETLDKTLKSVKGKDRAVLTFMFLFPFFPDDVLCFVAGLSSMSTKFYLIMITIVRFVTVFISCYAYNNSIIPYNTWWGILIWAIFIALTILLTIIIYKKGEKIEKYIKNKFKKITSKRKKI